MRVERIVPTIILAGLMAACAKAPVEKAISAPIKATESVAATAHSQVSPRQALVAEIERRFADERFSNAHWGLKIVSLDTDEVWFQHNEGRLFMPASNQKIPTTAAAILSLGPEFRFETTVHQRGTLSDGTLAGDLVVRGNGDPTIYTRFFDDSRDVFRKWAAELKSKGITRITGNVIGDDNAWSDSHHGNGWPLAGLDNWYYAEFGPLTFNENYVDVQVVPPATVDGKVELKPNVESDYFKLVNNIEVVAEGRNSVSFDRPLFSNEITFSGSVVAGGSSQEITPTITNPTLFYITALVETLEAEGIAVDGAPVDCDDLAGYTSETDSLPKLIVHQSPPLPEILNGLMKRSQNMYAETMIYAMGWKATGLGTFRSGRNQIEEALKTIGVEPEEYVYSDGSGLSRNNYLSPNTIIKIYDKMLETPYKDIWWEAQSIAGVDGTIRSRMKGTAAEGNMRGKTGNISNVRSLSGYVKTADGEQLAFSFLCNAHTRSSSDVDAIYDGVVKLLAEYKAAGM